jgi:predicted enzyme related to lactoylglutathione lyase
MNVPHNVVGWFEIPVADMDRAVRFYETVLGYTLDRQSMGDLEMAWFPWKPETTGAPGSLVRHPEFYRPSGDGTLVYLTAFSGDLANELARVATAGGTVLMEKKMISQEYGFMGLFLDTEGNRVALHSRS